MLKETTNAEYLRLKSSLDDDCGCAIPKRNTSSNSGSSSNSGDSECCYTDVDIISDVVAGAINPLDVVPKGSSLTDFIKQLLLMTFNPTFVDASFALSHNAGPYHVINSVISSFVLTFTTDRGVIIGKLTNGIWVPTAYQNPLIGLPITFVFYYPDSNLIGIVTTNTITVYNYIVFQGLNTFSAIENYGIGLQPTNSKGANYGNPNPANTSPVVQTSFEGVYPLFATTVSLGVSTQQPLYSMLYGNNIEIVLVPELGTDKQYFEIPKVWTDARPLTKVEYFNVVTNQFDPTQKLQDFIVSSTTKTIEGSTVNYKKYYNDSLKRGEIKIRLIF